MKNLGDLKKDIKNNPELKSYFANIKNEKEAAEIAKKLGYEISEEELKNDEELNEEMLGSVAGGDTNITRKLFIDASPGIFRRIDIDEETGNVIGYELY